jgi:opacity protein-like surface antigen
MMNIKTLISALLLGTSALALPAAAAAQTSRIYFAGYLGLNTYEDQKFTEKTTNNNGDFQLDNATSFAGAIGLRLSRQLRLEGEFSYRNAEFKDVVISNVGSFSTGGQIDSKVALANLYYDFDVPWKIQPYVGGGVGYAFHNGTVSDGSGLLTNANIKADGFVWNAGAGLKYRPRTDLAYSLGYRYLSSPSLSFGDYEMDYSTHEFRLGLEWDLPVR